MAVIALVIFWDAFINLFFCIYWVTALCAYDCARFISHRLLELIVILVLFRVVVVLAVVGE